MLNYLYSEDGTWLLFLLCVVASFGICAIAGRIIGNIRRKIRRCIRMLRRGLSAGHLYSAQLRRLRVERRKVSRKVICFLLEILRA